MRILDKQRVWAFFKAYCTCYVSLVGLFIVIDAFSNMDEFQKRAHGVIETMAVMGRYYLTHQAAYFDLLGSVIGMMAAIFTVTWMQKNNEHLAMLAAGISTHRAIRPVIFCSVIVSRLSVVNQEIMIPRNAEEIQKSHADDGVKKVDVSSRYDSRGVMIDGRRPTGRPGRSSRGSMPPSCPKSSAWRKARGQAGHIHSARGGTDTVRGGWLVRSALGSRRIGRAGTSGTRRVDPYQGQEHRRVSRRPSATRPR